MGGSPPGLGTIVGREQELATLDAAVRRALDGAGAVCLVTGPAGVGKTRLLTELAERTASAGVVLGWGRAWDGEGSPAYWPWAQALRSLVRTEEQGLRQPPLVRGASRSYLIQAMPALASVLDAGPPEHPVASAGARFLVFDAVVEALTSAAAERPVLVVLDDLHGADLASIQLLEFIAAEVRRQPIAILGAFRDQHPLDDPSALSPGPHGSVLETLGDVVRLGGLDDDAVAEVVERALGARPSPHLVDRLCRLTGGNPFFVGELARSLAGVTDVPAGDAVPLPASLRSLVRERVARLEEPARSVLALASVLGEEFAIGALAGAVAEDRAATLVALDAAVSAGLLREVGVARYRFVHALTRESLYADLGAIRRRELHAAVGRALEHVYAGREAEHAVELAEHFGRAAVLGDIQPAVHYARLAAGQAAAAAAYDDAARSFRMALEALELGGSDPAMRAELLLGLAEAETRGTACDVAVGTFGAAARLAAAVGRADLLGRAAVGATRAHFRLAGYVLDLDVRLSVLEDAAAATAGRGDPLEAMVLAALAWTRSVSSTDVDAIGLADTALALARSTGDGEAIRLAIHARRWALEGSGDPADKKDATAAVLREAGDDIELVWWGHRWALLDALEACDGARVHEELAQVDHLAARLREPYFTTFVTLFRSAVALLEGRFDDADELATLAESQALGSRVGPEHIAGLRLFLDRERGRLDMSAIAPFLDAYPEVPVFQALAAWGHANTGDLEAARLSLQRLEGPLRQLPRSVHWLATLALAAEASHRCDDPAIAAAVAPHLLAAGDRGVVIGGPLLWTGSAAHYAGLALVTAGELDAGRDRLASGRAAHLRLGAAPFVAVSDAALGAEPPRSSTPPGRSPLAAALRFARAGDFWEVGRPERPVLVRHSLGMAYLRALLDAPGQDRHVLDLAAGGVAPGDARGAGDAVFDERARAAYRRRYDDLTDALAEAEAWNDAERGARIREELDALAGELARGIGLGGRIRTTASPAERARVNVTRAIRSAIARIGEHDRDLSGLLDAAVTTGTFCRYQPVPGGPTWQP